MQKVVTIYDSDDRVIARQAILTEYPELDNLLKEGYVVKQILPLVISEKMFRISITFLLEKIEYGDEKHNEKFEENEAVSFVRPLKERF